LFSQWNRCIGGFAIAMLYGLPRPTVDVDYLSVVRFLKRRRIVAKEGFP